MRRATDRDPRELDGAWEQHQTHARLDPRPALAPFVGWVWQARWSYPTPYVQKVVPYPQVNLTVRRGGPPMVRGVATRHVEQVLEGDSGIIGAAFHPGRFRALLDAPVASLTDRFVPADDVPGLPTPLPSALDDPDALQDWLGDLGEPDPRGVEAGRIVALIADDPGLATVEQVAAVCGMSVRSLQRLFTEHVGAGPKWVLRRYRLHEVTARLAAGAVVDWAGVAADLGYADQAHLVRDFSAVFGEPPGAYALRYPGGGRPDSRRA